ncbi:MAG: hypothetical protein WBD87_07880 [Candidatus Acidiferrales bacterium]
MWIEASELVVALATVVFGGGRLFAQFRKIDTVKELRDGLNDITAEKAFSPDAQEPDLLLDFLKYSQLIMGPLRAKLIRRFLCVIGFVLASAPLPLVLVDKGLVTNEAKAWALTIGVELLQVGLAVLTGKFQEAERDFLENSAMLHERFYDLYVLPAMHVFNNAVRTTTVFGPARKAGVAASSNTREQLQDVLKKTPKYFQDILNSSLQNSSELAAGQASARKSRVAPGDSL